MSFRTERSVVKTSCRGLCTKNLGNAHVNVHEILPPYGRLNNNWFIFI